MASQKKMLYGLVAGSTVDVAPIVEGAIEVSVVLTLLGGTFAQIGVEQVLPGIGLELGDLGDDTIQIENRGIDLLARDSELRCTHGVGLYRRIVPPELQLKS